MDEQRRCYGLSGYQDIIALWSNNIKPTERRGGWIDEQRRCYGLSGYQDIIALWSNITSNQQSEERDGWMNRGGVTDFQDIKAYTHCFLVK